MIMCCVEVGFWKANSRPGKEEIQEVWFAIQGVVRVAVC